MSFAGSLPTSLDIQRLPCEALCHQQMEVDEGNSMGLDEKDLDRRI